MGDRVKLVFFGDVHLGHRLSSLSNFKKEVIERYRKEENVWFIDMGDGMDLIVSQTSDKRFKASQIDTRYVGIDSPIDLMIEDYAKLLEPIKDRLLCIVDSNHHLSIMERTGTDPTRRLAYTLWPDDAENRYMGYSGFLVLKFHYKGDRSSRLRKLILSLCHGLGSGGKTEGGFQTQLGHDASFYTADVHAYGHNHRLAGWDRVKIGVDRDAKRIISTKEIRLNTGTYLKSLSDDASTSYAEKLRFKPNELGHMELNIRFHRNGEEIYWVKRSVL